MAPAVDLSLPGHVLPRHQVTATSTIAPLPLPVLGAPFKIKVSPNTKTSPTSTPGAVRTPSSSPTSVPPYSANIHWTPAVKLGLFIFGAFVCLAFFFVLLRVIRRIRKQLIFQRAAEQRIRDIENRRREAASQWQRLEMDRYAEDERDWEMQNHARIMRYAERVEEGEFQKFRNTPLAAQDSAHTRGHRRCHAGDQAQREEIETRGSNDPTMAPSNAKAGGQKSFERELSSGSSSGMRVEIGQNSSRTEHDGNYSKPLSSDEVLRAVNALGYESISDSQRANARARALKDLEGR
jgi:hypothetical protein